MSDLLKAEIKEVERLIADHFAKAGQLQTKLSGLKQRLQEEEGKNDTKKDDVPRVEELDSSAPAVAEATTAAPTKATVVASGTYVPIESFYWDQGQYNSPTVSVYLEVENVGSVKDKVDVTFTKTSFDAKVMDLNGKNYRLVKENLEKDIIPENCKFIVKNNKIILKLAKVKGEYSYESWTSLTAKKSRAETAASKKDPGAGIMDMMKDMYDSGDENMKKIIGEAMLKSRNGEAPSAPSMAGDF